MDSSETIVDLEHVSVAYGPILAIEDVTFRVKRGQFVGVIGPNGSGKSTLLRVVLGLSKPIRGTVQVFGKPREKLGVDVQRIGYVPQLSTLDRSFPVRAGEVVLMGRYGRIGLMRRPGRGDREAARHALEQVGMSEFSERQIGRLSGGQLQRILVARALAAEPELLLLDEPTTGIDATTTESLYDLINKLNKDLGLTIILVSHDLNVVSKYVDTVACMNRRMATHGRPCEVLGSEMLKDIYGDGVMFFTHGKVPHMVVDTVCLADDHAAESNDVDGNGR
jgi:zinc transport system ATP-binding protein